MNGSHERKALGLQLFCVLLPHLTAADVPFVLRGNFMRTISGSLKNHDRYLHKSATRCIDRLVGWASGTSADDSGDASGGAVLFLAPSCAGSGDLRLSRLQANDAMCRRWLARASRTRRRTLTCACAAQVQQPMDSILAASCTSCSQLRRETVNADSVTV